MTRFESSANNLLFHDLRCFVAKLAGTALPRLDLQLCIQSLNLAEVLSRDNNSKARQEALLISALVWEHRSLEWTNIEPFLLEILARIGMLPSAKMLHDKNEFDGLLPAPYSFIDSLRLSAQVLKKTVKVGDENELLLSQFQLELWKKIGSSRRLGISAPTSAGKTFVLINRTLDLLNRGGGNAMIVVPTISLINQISIAFRNTIRESKLVGFRVYQAVPNEFPFTQHSVFILTQERALAALDSVESFGPNLKIVCIDEVQNIERAVAGKMQVDELDEEVEEDDDERASDLLKLISRINSEVDPQKLIISGPGIQNIHELSKKLMGADTESIAETEAPVLNLTYAFVEKKDHSLAIVQYNSANQMSLEVALPTDVKMPSIFGKSSKKYTPEWYDFIRFILNAYNVDGGTILFSPTKLQSENNALGVGKILTNEVSENLESLVEYLEQTVHPNYQLIPAIRNGLAFHHSGVPKHVRFAVEESFSRGQIPIICTTSTLLQGINLPAKTIIARNPYVNVKKINGRLAQLTGYEFSNLKGRAGRLMQDFVGRTVILDGNSFSSEGIPLDRENKTQIEASYEARFEANRNAIVNASTEGGPITKSLDNKTLVTVIRSTCAAFPESATIRLEQIGIKLTNSESEAVVARMASLTVPKMVVVSNPHWDPLALEELYNRFLRFRGKDPNWAVPKSAFAPNFRDRIKEILLGVEGGARFYFDKYLHRALGSFPDLHRIVSIGASWCTESPLNEILSYSPEITGKQIGEILNLLNGTIPYSIPKLLAPFISMEGKDNSLLSSMESGSFRPITRELIRTGLGREPAIRLVKSLSDLFDIDPNQIQDIASVKFEIQESLKRLSYWDQIQVETFVLTN